MEFKIECLAMSIVNNTNEKNEVSVDTRQKNNDECFDYAKNKIKEFLSGYKELTKEDWKLIVNALLEDSVTIIASCEECKKVMGKTYDEEKKRADRLIYLANVLDGRKKYVK